MPQRERRVPALAAEAQLGAWGRGRAIGDTLTAEDECEDTATMPNVREGKDEEAGNMLHRREPGNRAGGG